MRTIVAVAAILGLLLVATSANAAFQLSLDDGVGNSAVITDELAGDAANPLPGAISTTQFNLGNWLITVAAAVSKPVDGTANSPVIELHVLAVSTTAGTLTVIATNTDFGPLDPVLDSDRVSAGGLAAAGASVDVYGWFDTTNTEFGTELPKPSLLDLGPLAFSGTAIAAMPAALVAGANPFSMTLAVAITHTGAGTTSLDARNDALPEPATLAIWSLLGVAGVMLSRRRRAA